MTATPSRAIRIPADGSPLREEAVLLEYPDLGNMTVGAGRLIERVQPFGLAYWEGAYGHTQLIMIVDEEGSWVPLPINQRAGWLYGSHIHNTPIYGDAWIIAEGMTHEGPDFVPLPPSVDVGTVERLLAAAHSQTEWPPSEVLVGTVA